QRYGRGGTASAKSNGSLPPEHVVAEVIAALLRQERIGDSRDDRLIADIPDFPADAKLDRQRSKIEVHRTAILQLLISEAIRGPDPVLLRPDPADDSES